MQKQIEGLEQELAAVRSSRRDLAQRWDAEIQEARAGGGEDRQAYVMADFAEDDRHLWEQEQYLVSEILLAKVRSASMHFPSQALQPSFWRLGIDAYEDVAFLSEAGQIEASRLIQEAADKEEQRQALRASRRTTYLSLWIALASVLLALFSPPIEYVWDLLLPRSSDTASSSAAPRD